MAETKINVRAIINDLEVGDFVELPLTRYDYVNSCCRRLQNSEKKQFSLKIDKDKDGVIVTRNTVENQDPTSGQK